MKFRLIIDKNKDEEVVVTSKEKTELVTQIEALVQNAQHRDGFLGYAEDDTRLLTFSEIECITVQDGKTIAVCSDGTKHRIRMRLYEAESVLPDKFIRINKSAIANLSSVRRFTATIGGGVDAVFQCGYREYVSRRCFAEIKRRFDKR